jgi:hypothetical protein
MFIAGLSNILQQIRQSGHLLMRLRGSSQSADIVPFQVDNLVWQAKASLQSWILGVVSLVREVSSTSLHVRAPPRHPLLNGHPSPKHELQLLLLP